MYTYPRITLYNRKNIFRKQIKFFELNFKYYSLQNNNYNENVNHAISNNIVIATSILRFKYVVLWNIKN